MISPRNFQIWLFELFLNDDLQQLLVLLKVRDDAIQQRVLFLQLTEPFIYVYIIFGILFAHIDERRRADPAFLETSTTGAP